MRQGAALVLSVSLAAVLAGAAHARRINGHMFGEAKGISANQAACASVDGLTVIAEGLGWNSADLDCTAPFGSCFRAD
jgi:hypothetical protein